MSASLKIVVVILLLAVTVVFVSPAVDLEPTALRAAQAASLLFAVLSVAGSFIASNLHTSSLHLVAILSSESVPFFATDLVDMNCNRLC
jgi:uncharacterized membrane protein